MEEIDAAFTETVFNHRWALLEGYHAIGKAIIANKLDIEEVARTARQRPKTVHYCVELAKRYPDIDSIPDGKNVSWYKITKTLPPYEKNRPQKKDRPQKQKRIKKGK